jgi:hypothetical protein
MNISSRTAFVLAKGNWGAMQFVVDLVQYSTDNAEKAEKILHKIKSCTTIRGINLHVLYSDICEKNMGAVYQLCENCPDGDLEEACSRQDYSGWQIVYQYLVPV